MHINYPAGAPGSFFTVTGNGYPTNSVAHIYINSYELGTTKTDTSGDFTIILDTAAAGAGFYM